MPKTEEIQDAEIEIVDPAPPGALQVRPSGPVSLLDLGLQDQELAMERFANLNTSFRRFCLSLTEPGDWVLMRAKDGSESALLIAAGAMRIRPMLGLRIVPVSGWPGGGLEPQATEEDGHKGFYLRALVSSSFLPGEEIEIEASRFENEDFIGRVGKTRDLKNATSTLLRTKAVRILAGLAKVPKDALDRAWQGSGKTTSGCTKGSGYGRSEERTAASVSEGGLEEAKSALRDELLRRTGGDEKCASQLCKEITSWTDKESGKVMGFTSVARITKQFQLDQAWKRLKEHPTYGDAAMKGDE